MKTQEKTSYTQETQERIDFKKDKPRLTAVLLHFSWGFICALFPDKYGISPFAAGAVASCEREYSVYVFLGAVIGYFLSHKNQSALWYVCTLTFVSVSRSVSEKTFKVLNKKIVSAVFASLFLLAKSMIYFVLYGFSVSGVILAAAEALLCFGISYFYSKTLKIPVLKLGIHRLSRVNFACIIISAASLFICLSGVEILSFYPFHVVACVIVLFCALYRGISGGSVMGIILGILVSLSVETSVLFYMYAFAALLAGAFAPIGQYAVSAVFCVSSVASLLIFSRGEVNFMFALEAVVSCAVFMAIPSKLICRIEDYLIKNGLGSDNETNFQVALSLEAAAKTVEEVTDIVERVSEKMDSIIDPHLSRVYAKLQHGVCAGCENKSLCWSDEFESTVSEIEKIARLSLSTEKSDVSLVACTLVERCENLDRLCLETGKIYREYMNQTDLNIKIDEMRSVVSDQFMSIAHLLYDIANTIVDSKTPNENKERAIREALIEAKLPFLSVSYYENAFSRAVVEVKTYEEIEKVKDEKIKKAVSLATRKVYEEVQIEVKDFATVLTLRQKSEISVTVGVCQIPGEIKSVCGDCIETLQDDNGNVIAILSDGMGTGKRAAVDGTMTCSLMQKLLLSGFTFESALRLVNSALIIKSSDESLSTIDSVCINTYNGICTFYKAGAAASFVRHDGKITCVQSGSFPVGILRNVEFHTQSVTLKVGDIVLLVSDGVNLDEDLINRTLLSWSTDNMQELATHIADMAKLKNAQSFDDDISVIALKII